MSVVNRTVVSPNYEIFHIHVDAANVIPNFDKQLKSYAKKAEIPGFRKGMVPLGIAKKIYGASIFTREIYDAAEKQLMEYIKKEAIEILGQPLLSKIPDNQPDFTQSTATYQFEFEIGIKPTVTLPIFEGKEFVQYQIEITDTMLQQNVERLQKEFGNEVSTHIIKDSNTIIHFQIALTEKEQVLAVSAFSEGFQQILTGKKVNDTVDMIPANDIEEGNHKKHLLSSWGIDDQTANQQLALTITKINFIEPAIINKELFDKVYPNQNIDTEEAFKNKIKEETSVYFLQQTKHELYHQLEHYLVDNTTIDIPIDFLKKWATINDKNKTEEEINNEFPKLLNNLRWNFIVEALVKLSGVQVSFEEIQTALEDRIRAYFHNSVDDGMIQEQVKKLLSNEEYVYSTQQQLLTDKLFVYVANNVNIKPKHVSLEDFIKATTQQQHKH